MINAEFLLCFWNSTAVQSAEFVLLLQYHVDLLIFSLHHLDYDNNVNEDCSLCFFNKTSQALVTELGLTVSFRRLEDLQSTR